MFHEPKYIILVALVALTGCKSDEGGGELNNVVVNNTVAPNNTNTLDNSTPGGLQVLASKNPRVRFKGGERWANQLGRALDLDRSELCQEFGQYDCASDVHFIALGGVEPYRLRIQEPLPNAPLSAPIAVERIALSACSERAERDVESPADAVIYKELSAEPAPEDIQAMAGRLYQRLMSRDARPEELAEFETYWEELAAEDGVDLQREWATYTCFALASSTEMLFY